MIKVVEISLSENEKMGRERISNLYLKKSICLPNTLDVFRIFEETFIIMDNDRWKCSKCGAIVYEKPANKYVKCSKCGNGRYRLLRTCLCGKEFSPLRYKQQTCSKECGYKYGSHGGKKGKHYPHLQRAKTKVCPVCGKEFRAVNDSINHSQVYCSKECWSHRKPPIDIECPYCGKHFMAYLGRQLYCSSECADKDRSRKQRGENSHFWKGGKTKESIIKRSSAEYKNWRLAVFTRDGFKCQLCGKRARDLEAHHIKAVCDYPDLIFDVDNGVSLCHKCHKLTDNYGYKARWKKCRVEADGSHTAITEIYDKEYIDGLCE